MNIAARLQTACPAGELCVSRAVRDEVHGRLGLTFEALGALELKNIARPVEAFLLRIGHDAAEAAGPGRLRRARMRRRVAFAGLAGVLLFGALSAAWEWRARREPATPPSPWSIAANAAPALSIAVLPFDNLSSDPDQGYSPTASRTI